MFEQEGVLPGAPEGLSFEHFLPWIHKIMLAYQDETKIYGMHVIVHSGILIEKSELRKK